MTDGRTGVMDDLLHKSITRLKAHMAAVQAGKAASMRGERTETNPILDCINDLPEIVRCLDAAELEIEAAFEAYEDAARAAIARATGEAA